MDIKNLEKRLNNISIEKDELNDDLKNTIHHLADLDTTNRTRILKYSMYDGFEKIYQIENDKYHDLIGKYSQAYLDICDFYVGEDLPRDNFKKNLIDIYLFTDYVIKNINVMNEYDVD